MEKQNIIPYNKILFSLNKELYTNCAATWMNREIFVSKAHRQWANP